MRIGVLSDTHDHVDALKVALDLLRDRGVEHYVHCGDVGGRRVFDLLAGLPISIVWGNNDFDVASLEAYGKRLGLSLGQRTLDITMGGKRFWVMHGDDYSEKRRAIESQNFDYLLQGHTHIYGDEKTGRTRVLNPGALYRARPKTVALLDTQADRVERIVVCP
jgi:uncharacterized protein